MSNTVIREILQREPGDYFQQKYEIEVLRPERLRKEKLMIARKKLYIPIRKREIEMHERLHEERLKILEEVKRVEKEEERKKRGGVKYKSKYYEVVRKRDREKEMKFIGEMNQKKENIKKRKKYGEYVKQFIHLDGSGDDEERDEDYREDTYRVDQRADNRLDKRDNQRGDHRGDDSRRDGSMEGRRNRLDEGRVGNGGMGVEERKQLSSHLGMDMVPIEKKKRREEEKGMGRSSLQEKGEKRTRFEEGERRGVDSIRRPWVGLEV